MTEKTEIVSDEILEERIISYRKNIENYTKMTENKTEIVSKKVSTSESITEESNKTNSSGQEMSNLDAEMNDCHNDSTNHGDVTNHDDITFHDDIISRGDVTSHDDSKSHCEVTRYDEITNHDEITSYHDFKSHDDTPSYGDITCHDNTKSYDYLTSQDDATSHDDITRTDNIPNHADITSQSDVKSHNVTTHHTNDIIHDAITSHGDVTSHEYLENDVDFKIHDDTTGHVDVTNPGDVTSHYSSLNNITGTQWGREGIGEFMMVSGDSAGDGEMVVVESEYLEESGEREFNRFMYLQTFAGLEEDSERVHDEEGEGSVNGKDGKEILGVGDVMHTIDLVSGIEVASDKVRKISEEGYWDQFIGRKYSEGKGGNMVYVREDVETGEGYGLKYKGDSIECVEIEERHMGIKDSDTVSMSIVGGYESKSDGTKEGLVGEVERYQEEHIVEERVEDGGNGTVSVGEERGDGEEHISKDNLADSEHLGESTRVKVGEVLYEEEKVGVGMGQVEIAEDVGVRNIEKDSMSGVEQMVISKIKYTEHAGGGIRVEQSVTRDGVKLEYIGQDDGVEIEQERVVEMENFGEVDRVGVGETVLGDCGGVFGYVKGELEGDRVGVGETVLGDCGGVFGYVSGALECGDVGLRHVVTARDSYAQKDDLHETHTNHLSRSHDSAVAPPMPGKGQDAATAGDHRTAFLHLQEHYSHERAYDSEYDILETASSCCSCHDCAHDHPLNAFSDEELDISIHHYSPGTLIKSTGVTSTNRSYSPPAPDYSPIPPPRRRRGLRHSPRVMQGGALTLATSAAGSSVMANDTACAHSLGPHVTVTEGTEADTSTHSYVDPQNDCALNKSQNDGEIDDFTHSTTVTLSDFPATADIVQHTEDTADVTDGDSSTQRKISLEVPPTIIVTPNATPMTHPKNIENNIILEHNGFINRDSLIVAPQIIFTEASAQASGEVSPEVGEIGFEFLKELKNSLTTDDNEETPSSRKSSLSSDPPSRKNSRCESPLVPIIETKILEPEDIEPRVLEYETVSAEPPPISPRRRKTSAVLNGSKPFSDQETNDSESDISHDICSADVSHSDNSLTTLETSKESSKMTLGTKGSSLLKRVREHKITPVPSRRESRQSVSLSLDLNQTATTAQIDALMKQHYPDQVKKRYVKAKIKRTVSDLPDGINKTSPKKKQTFLKRSVSMQKLPRTIVKKFSSKNKEGSGGQDVPCMPNLFKRKVKVSHDSDNEEQEEEATNTSPQAAHRALTHSQTLPARLGSPELLTPTGSLKEFKGSPMFTKSVSRESFSSIFGSSEPIDASDIVYGSPAKAIGALAFQESSAPPALGFAMASTPDAALADAELAAVISAGGDESLLSSLKTAINQDPCILEASASEETLAAVVSAGGDRSLLRTLYATEPYRTEQVTRFIDASVASGLDRPAHSDDESGVELERKQLPALSNGVIIKNNVDTEKIDKTIDTKSLEKSKDNSTENVDPALADAELAAVISARGDQSLLRTLETTTNQDPGVQEASASEAALAAVISARGDQSLLRTSLGTVSKQENTFDIKLSEKSKNNSIENGNGSEVYNNKNSVDSNIVITSERSDLAFTENTVDSNIIENAEEKHEPILKDITETKDKSENKSRLTSEGSDPIFKENNVESKTIETVSHDNTIENINKSSKETLDYDVVACEKWEHILNNDKAKVQVEDIENNGNSEEIIKANIYNNENENNDKIVGKESADNSIHEIIDAQENENNKISTFKISNELKKDNKLEIISQILEKVDSEDTVNTDKVVTLNKLQRQNCIEEDTISHEVIISDENVVDIGVSKITYGATDELIIVNDNIENKGLIDANNISDVINNFSIDNVYNETNEEIHEDNIGNESIENIDENTDIEETSIDTNRDSLSIETNEIISEENTKFTTQAEITEVETDTETSKDILDNAISKAEASSDANTTNTKYRETAKLNLSDLEALLLQSGAVIDAGEFEKMKVYLNPDQGAVTGVYLGSEESDIEKAKTKGKADAATAETQVPETSISKPIESEIIQKSDGSTVIQFSEEIIVPEDVYRVDDVNEKMDEIDKKVEEMVKKENSVYKSEVVSNIETIVTTKMNKTEATNDTENAVMHKEVNEVNVNRTEIVNENSFETVDKKEIIVGNIMDVIEKKMEQMIKESPEVDQTTEITPKQENLPVSDEILEERVISYKNNIENYFKMTEGTEPVSDEIVEERVISYQNNIENYIKMTEGTGAVSDEILKERIMSYKNNIKNYIKMTEKTETVSDEILEERINSYRKNIENYIKMTENNTEINEIVHEKVNERASESISEESNKPNSSVQEMSNLDAEMNDCRIVGMKKKSEIISCNETSSLNHQTQNITSLVISKESTSKPSTPEIQSPNIVLQTYQPAQDFLSSCYDSIDTTDGGPMEGGSRTSSSNSSGSSANTSPSLYSPWRPPRVDMRTWDERQGRPLPHGHSEQQVYQNSRLGSQIESKLDNLKR